MSTDTQPAPSKKSLTITLTEPVVILRTVDVAGAQRSDDDGISPPSMLRALLTLDLAKASRISSIEVELQAISHATWSEGLGTSEKRKIYSATQDFFRAAPSPSNRRALSVDPGVSRYSNEIEQSLPSFSQSALTAPSSVRVADEAGQRGRMRVRRRTSADNLVYQRDPVARHNRRPPPSSPLSSPPTREEEGATPTSPRFVLSHTSSSSSSSLETPVLAHTQPLRVPEHSRTSSLVERQSVTLSRSSSGVSRGTPTSTTETPTGKKKGHRSHVSLIGSIFRRGSSPGHDKSRPESLQSKRGREKNSTKRNGFISYHVAKVGEVFRIEEDHKEAGDGWQEFRKGTYTFPISFEIPSHLPGTLNCDGGSIAWKLVAEVRRPGLFKSKLTATRTVLVQSIPEFDVQATGGVTIEKLWNDQLQYLFNISGKVFAIGSSFNVKMTFMPLAKVKIFKLAIDLEERVDSYVSGMNMTRTVTTAHNLLNLQCDDESKPLLPLNQDDPLAYERSPFATLQHHQGNSSNVVSQLLGFGPWPVSANLHLPADCKVLHPTSRSPDSTIHVTHALRFTMRLTRGGSHVDPRTNKQRLFEVVVRTPVSVLSCWARAEYTTLPRYSETLESGSQGVVVCPCVPERERRTREGNTPMVGPWSTSPPQQFGGVPSDVLERTLAYERLVSGHESVLGDAPPAYDPGPMRAAVVAV